MLRLELLQRLKSIPLLILMDNAFICTTMHTNWGQRITWNRINRNSTMTWKCSSTAWRVLISFSSQILACYIHLLRSQLALVEHRLSQPCLPQLSPLTPWSVPRVSSAGPSTIVVFSPSAHELSFWNRMLKNQTPKTLFPQLIMEVLIFPFLLYSSPDMLLPLPIIARP